MADSPSPFSGDMLATDKPLTAAERKGLQLAKSKTVDGKKKTVKPVRHGELTLKPGEVSGSVPIRRRIAGRSTKKCSLFAA
jgi:hypothetical protein